MRRGVNVSWVAYPLISVVGAVLVVVVMPDHGFTTRWGGIGWVMFVGPLLAAVWAIVRIPALAQRGRLRSREPDSIVELVTRSGTMSKETTSLNAADGGERDARFRTVCVAFDRQGMSIWRSSDTGTPEWSVPWRSLSAPIAAPFIDVVLWSRTSYRGLSIDVTVDGKTQSVHLILVGAGFCGLFPLSQIRLVEIATRCSELRDAALAGSPTP